MPKNRLDLDFSLQYIDERVEFVNKYIEKKEFAANPLTNQELETIGNYILWGKNRKTGLNPRQDGSLIMPSKFGDWVDDAKCDSLDSLVEQPGFNEAQLCDNAKVVTRIKKEKFSRKQALESAPEYIRVILEQLFWDIDKLDLEIELWELKHGKRTKEIRPSLIKKFGAAAIEEMGKTISKWNQYRYLKKKHELVELRRQQYTLRDSYSAVATRHTAPAVSDFEGWDWDVDVAILPLGLKDGSRLGQLVFGEPGTVDPNSLGEEDLEKISDLVWEKKKIEKRKQSREENLGIEKKVINGVTYVECGQPKKGIQLLDFRNEDHIYQLLQLSEELRAEGAESEWRTNTQSLIETLDFYIACAQLSEVEQEICYLKTRKEKNDKIAAIVNKKYGKGYTANYISTIFKQRVVKKIAAGARLHLETIENIFFPEEFKTCTCCGRTLLRTSDNFTKRTRSSDGFSPRCKQCEKEIRQGGKR